MQKKKACIVIPVYQKISEPSEIFSLKRGLEIFANYTIIFVCPQSFDESLLSEYMKLHSNIFFEKFADENFTSVKSYSSLLIKSEFYQRFSNYEFMLLYQTDAYVFSDQLEYWCNKGIDYIGAPWFKKFDTENKYYEFIPVAGNGGFSLRNIFKINKLMVHQMNLRDMRKFLRLMKKTRFYPHNSFKFYLKFFSKKRTFSDVCEFMINNSDFTNEDYFFAFVYPQMFDSFRSSTALEAIPFSFETKPEYLYTLNDNKLPFGCHAWRKYSPEFWKKFINF